MAHVKDFHRMEQLHAEETQTVANLFNNEADRLAVVNYFKPLDSFSDNLDDFFNNNESDNGDDTTEDEDDTTDELLRYIGSLMNMSEATTQHSIEMISEAKHKLRLYKCSCPASRRKCLQNFDAAEIIKHMLDSRLLDGFVKKVALYTAIKRTTFLLETILSLKA